jgi:hypothetical protein
MVEFSTSADYTFEIVGSRFGFVDTTYRYATMTSGDETVWTGTHVELGRLGQFAVPVRAGVAWALLLLTILAAATATVLWWRRGGGQDHRGRQEPATRA